MLHASSSAKYENAFDSLAVQLVQLPITTLQQVYEACVEYREKGEGRRVEGEG